MAHAQKPDFVFRRNGRVHLNRRGASVQSTADSRGVRISGNNAGYTMFRGSVKGTGYPLHSPVSPQFPSLASPCAITFQLSLPTKDSISSRTVRCRDSKRTDENAAFECHRSDLCNKSLLASLSPAELTSTTRVFETYIYQAGRGVVTLSGVHSSGQLW